jgi:hypothetical protein
MGVEDWRISPEDGHSIQFKNNETHSFNEWVDVLKPSDLPDLSDWAWEDDDIIILNRTWFDDNYAEIKDWFVEQCLITHLTFEGSSRIHVKGITPELKTMFTLRWK